MKERYLDSDSQGRHLARLTIKVRYLDSDSQGRHLARLTIKVKISRLRFTGTTPGTSYNQGKDI